MENNQNLFKCDKIVQAAGVPFQIVERLGEYEKTGYSWYLNEKRLGRTGAPLLARTKDGKFEIFMDGTWVEKNRNDYWYDELDKAGRPVIKNGKQSKRNYFEKKVDWVFEFEKEIPIEIYNKEIKAKEVKQLKKCIFSVSGAFDKKLTKEQTDPRNRKDSWFKIKHDKTKMPAEQYMIEFVR